MSWYLNTDDKHTRYYWLSYSNSVLNLFVIYLNDTTTHTLICKNTQLHYYTDTSMLESCYDISYFKNTQIHYYTDTSM